MEMIEVLLVVSDNGKQNTPLFFVHGYSLGFKLVFECDSLDERNWVMDFGGLKE